MKLVFLCPHLSTGGMPQYTLKMIEEFKKTMRVSVIEVDNYSNEYVVQRNKIASLVPVKQLFSDQESLIPYLKELKPDIVHCQEIPETFIPRVVKDFYSSRDYNIIVTTHSSRSNGKSFRYLPDRIVTVNQWQKELFQRELPKIEVDMWEYPIEKKSHLRLDYSSTGPTGMGKAREILGFEKFDYRKKDVGLHILNVGLFTPGKNQGELFEIARKNPQNRYHFVGNQAGNPDFRAYWEPLMKNKPSNCIVWGERSDVELFYQACDEMWFTSIFELNPLCVREALSYGMPVKMRRLPTYGTQYDNNPLVTYTDFKTNK